MLGESGHLVILSGDVQEPVSLDRAAAGCGIIIHAVNYPYHEWDPHMVTATQQVLRVARAYGATVLFPGNVYGLGRQTGRPLDESVLNVPVSRKGEIRVRLEDSLRQAAYAGQIRAIILRAGDYFGPTVRNGLVDRIFGRAAAGESIVAFGNLDIPHQWAYVPDLARVAIDLLERREQLPEFDLFHFAGYTAHPQRAFLQMVAEVAGHPDLPIRATPWWLLSTINPFNPVVRELKETPLPLRRVHQPGRCQAPRVPAALPRHADRARGGRHYRKLTAARRCTPENIARSCFPEMCRPRLPNKL